jgi:hypothetical protein
MRTLTRTRSRFEELAGYCHESITGGTFAALVRLFTWWATGPAARESATHAAVAGSDRIRAT